MTCDVDAIAHVFHEAAQEVGLRPQKETTGLLQPCPDSDALPQRASLDRLAHVWILHGKDMIFAVTSYLRPAARHPGATTSSTPNLTEQMKQTAGTHDYNATIRNDNSNRSTTNAQARSVATLAQAISCSNVRMVFLRHELFWFCLVQVSAFQFWFIPFVFMANAGPIDDAVHSGVSRPGFVGRRQEYKTQA